MRKRNVDGERIKVAIVGRPNVGKSTLFNRLAGRRIAIVDDTPGVTRDRREAEGRLQGIPLLIIDTAGYEEAFDERLEARMREQTERAIEDADVALFLIDARAGLTPLDRSFAEVLRRSGKPVIVCANKAEARIAESGVLDAYALGLGEPVAISAEHGQGLDEVAHELRDLLRSRRGPPAEDAQEIDPEAEEDEGEGEEADAGPKRPLNLAIVGRPNVGKSTLINTLLGEERLLTGPEAGITRDSIAVPLSHKGRPLMVYDTAGMRRRTKVQERLERLSVADTLAAIRFADVVVLLMDSLEAFEKQDLQIADLVEREGRAMVLAYNKWDLIEDKKTAWASLNQRAERLLPQLKGIEEIAVSGETGRGLDRMMAAVFRAHEVWSKRVSTSPLNRWLETAIERHPPPAAKGRRIKIKYMTQAKARPPTFVVFCQRADELPDDYTRYLINGIRERFGFPGAPIRLQLRAQKNPYATER